MKSFLNVCFICIFLFLLYAVIGCGGDDEKDVSEENEFKIPDSLLYEGIQYKLTRDDYDSQKGGIMAVEKIELIYPPSNIAKFISAKIFGYAVNASDQFESMMGRSVKEEIVLVGTMSLDEYKERTGKEWWYYGVIRGDTIIFEPLDLLISRQIAEIAVRQKIAQLMLERISAGKIPLWMREAVASEFANEQFILEMQLNEFRNDSIKLKHSPQEIELALSEARDRRETRIAFSNAYEMLGNLVKDFSIQDAIRFIGMLGEGYNLDEASNDVFGMSYGELVENIRIDIDKRE